jgi:hypothetical protein
VHITPHPLTNSASSCHRLLPYTVWAASRNVGYVMLPLHSTFRGRQAAVQARLGSVFGRVAPARAIE